MKRRMSLMLSIVAVFLVAVSALKFSQVRAAIAQNSAFQPPPEAVTTTVVRQETWPGRLAAIGTAVAMQGVVVSADLPGIVERFGFESGRSVAKGTVLAELDVRQEKAQLASAEAALELARLNLERSRGLREAGILAQSDLDTAVATHAQAAALVRQIHATIERKTIRAPFSGILGIRQANVGQYLAAGDKVVPLQSLDPIYVDFAVPQQTAALLRDGTTVEVKAQGAADAILRKGSVTAVDSVVDPATRTVQVRSTLPNPDGSIRPGMFVEVEASAGSSLTLIPLPGSAVSYAPFGDSVFVVKQLRRPNGTVYRGVEQQFVKLGPSRGDLVAVLSGLSPGQEVVTSGAFKLRTGAAVEVNNKVQPGSDPAPKPQDS